jgi:pyruvate dehydrogenase E2 component (dihydrolipoamide acetyltransferase)
MATQVEMPKLSPTMEEGQISKWLKKEGDSVSMGEPLAEIETDKANMEMTALSAGVLRKILIKEGETAPLGQVIAIIGEKDEDISSLLKGQSASAPQKKAAAAGSEQPATPSDTHEAQASTPQQKQVAPGNGHTAAASGRVLVSPLAARMAAEAGISLQSLQGSGPGGRIIKRDIEEAMRAGQSSAQPQRAGHLRAVEPSRAPSRTGPVSGPSTFRDEPLSEMRRTIARRLSSSIGPVPHFFLTVDIDMERAAQLRQSLLEMEPDLKISFNDIIIKVAAASLIQHPAVNASFQEKAIRYYDNADIGVAVAIEDGLITPVIRSADQKPIGEIAREVRELAERARNKRLRPEEYTGASFSISNLGMFGIDQFTAVINPPEAAILAVGAIESKVVVRDNQMTMRQMMNVTMSCDHRVIDGATGAKFLQTFKKILENPLYMLL